MSEHVKGVFKSGFITSTPCHGEFTSTNRNRFTDGIPKLEKEQELQTASELAEESTRFNTTFNVVKEMPDFKFGTTDFGQASETAGFKLSVTTFGEGKETPGFKFGATFTPKRSVFNDRSWRGSTQKTEAESRLSDIFKTDYTSSVTSKNMFNSYLDYDNKGLDSRFFRHSSCAIESVQVKESIKWNSEDEENPENLESIMKKTDENSEITESKMNKTVKLAVCAPMVENNVKDSFYSDSEVEDSDGNVENEHTEPAVVRQHRASYNRAINLDTSTDSYDENMSSLSTSSDEKEEITAENKSQSNRKIETLPAVEKHNQSYKQAVFDFDWSPPKSIQRHDPKKLEKVSGMTPSYKLPNDSYHRACNVSDTGRLDYLFNDSQVVNDRRKQKVDSFYHTEDKLGSEMKTDESNSATPALSKQNITYRKAKSPKKEMWGFYNVKSGYKVEGSRMVAPRPLVVKEETVNNKDKNVVTQKKKWFSSFIKKPTKLETKTENKTEIKHTQVIVNKVSYPSHAWREPKKTPSSPKVITPKKTSKGAVAKLKTRFRYRGSPNRISDVSAIPIKRSRRSGVSSITKNRPAALKQQNQYDDSF